MQDWCQAKNAGIHLFPQEDFLSYRCTRCGIDCATQTRRPKVACRVDRQRLALREQDTTCIRRESRSGRSVKIWKSIEQMSLANQREKQTSREIMPAVGQHTGKEASTQDGKASEERAIDADQEHAADALVSMGGAEDESRDSHANGGAVQQGDGLQLQVATENELFRKSNDKAQRAPCSDLQAIGGRERHELPGHLDLLLPW